MKDHSKVRRLLDAERNRKSFLIAVHRGISRGNLMENTIAGHRATFRCGGDMSELDVASSKDGILYTIHDGEDMQLRQIGRAVSVCDLTAAEVDQLEYLNTSACPVGHIERFAETLAGLKGCGLLNIDRAFNCWEKALQILEKADMAEQLLLKSPIREDCLEQLSQTPTPFMYMPVLRSPDELPLLRKYNLNLVGYEVLFDREDHPLLDRELQKELTAHGEFLWANAIDLGNVFNLTAHHTDTGALLESEDAHWGWLLDHGFSVLQTDFPAELRDYRNRRQR